MKWEELILSGTDEHIKTELEYFAEQVDSQIQNTLISNMIERHVEISKQLETKSRQLERSDANRREAQEIALLGNWELNIATGKFRWSDTTNKILEVDDTTEPSLEWYLKKVHPEDIGVVNQVLEEIWKGKIPAEHRYRLKTKSGESKWIHVRCVLGKDLYGGSTEIHGTLQDISNMKTAEEELKKYNDHLEKLVQEKVGEISASQMTTIYALVTLAESRDDDTGTHITRTAQYCRLLAEKLCERGEYPEEIDQEFIEGITQASPLHDIGKVGIPDVILLKPGKLTAEEFEIMKNHTVIGYNTLASVGEKGAMSSFIKLGMEITLCHHEKWDGKGYPNGLREKEIPISARIMALADVYDALRSKRVYKESYSHEKSVSIIKEGTGTHFEPVLIDIFLENHQEFCKIFDQSQDTEYPFSH